MKSKPYFQKNSIITVVYILCMLSLAGVQSLHAAVDVSATLSPLSFPMDRAAALNIVVKGVRSFQPQIATVDGLQFHPRGQSTQMEMINGSFSVSVTSTYLVQAFREGTFTIPAIEVHTKKGTARTKPISFEVTSSHTGAVASSTQTGSGAAASTGRLRSGEADKVAFLRVTPAKTTSYSGEVVPLQVKVYFREGIKANVNSLPQLHGEGFVLQQLSQAPQQTRERINNTPYAVLTWESTLSGIKEGTHKLSVEIDATLLLPENRRSSSRGQSMFNDPFFNNFFSSYQEKAVKVASPDLEMKVLSLPEKGQPDDFSGAIGDFHLSVTAKPLEVAPGDPITLTMTVSGQGNFDRIQAPQLSVKKGWKNYTPSSEFLKDGDLGRGKKIFEQALVMKDPDLKEIPAITFSYYDPSAAAYKTLSTDAIPLKVQGNVPEEAAPVPVQQDQLETEKPYAGEVLQKVTRPISDLAPLQLAPGMMDQQLTPLFAKKWFQILVAVLLLTLCIAVIWKVRAARYAANPRLQRDQAMKNLFALRVQEIDQTLAANDTRGFLVNCRKAIQEQLALVWETESGAITLGDLQKRLPDNSVLLAVFKAADESTYGGQELSQQEMQDSADRLKIELEGLR